MKRFGILSKLIYQDFKNGFPEWKLVKKYRLSYCAICSKLKSVSTSYKQKYRTASEHRAAEIVAAFRKGRSYSELKRLFEISKSALAEILRKHHLSRSRDPQVLEVKYNAVIKRLKAGHPMQEISCRFRLGQEGIKLIAIKYNVYPCYARLLKQRDLELYTEYKIGRRSNELMKKYYVSKKRLMNILKCQHRIHLRKQKVRLVKDLVEDYSSTYDELINSLAKTASFFTGLLDNNELLLRRYKNNVGGLIEVVDSLQSFTNLTTICRWFGFSKTAYQRWRQLHGCRVSVKGKCLKQSPNQLSKREITTLTTQYFENPIYQKYSVADLYAQMLADQKILVSELSFYDIARLYGEFEKRKVFRKKIRTLGIRALQPLQIIHLDRTRLSLSGEIKAVWLSVICDNHSRAILSYRLHKTGHSKQTMLTLKDAVQFHSLQKRKLWLITDDGTENKGCVRKYLKGMPTIKHKIAMYHIRYSNAMIESVFRALKGKYLEKRIFESYAELVQAVNIAIEQYNNRPKKVLLGKTPLQVLKGDTQDLEVLKCKKEKLRRVRIEENRELACLKTTYKVIESALPSFDSEGQQVIC